MKRSLFTILTSVLFTNLIAEMPAAFNPSTQGQGIEFQQDEKTLTTRVLQFENEFVRVWKTTILPNQPLKMHRHDCARVIYGVKGGVLIRREQTGESHDLVIDTGKAYWYEADSKDGFHADVNPSSEPMEVLIVEVKATTVN